MEYFQGDCQLRALSWTHRIYDFLSPHHYARDKKVALRFAESSAKHRLKMKLGGAFGLFILAQVPADAGPAPTVDKTHLVFNLIREGSKIGSDVIDVDRQGGTTKVKCTTNISVKVLGIEAYRYEHTSIEIWKDSQLVAFSSQTDDNGTKHIVTAIPVSDKLTFKIDGERSDAPRGLVPATLWNTEFSKRSELFDAATGKRMAIKVVDLGEASLAWHGTARHTHHYKINGELDRELWFDGDVLVRLNVIGPDKSIIISDLRQSSDGEDGQ
jgi:hypothetical protein